jgi:hypothetical protein
MSRQASGGVEVFDAERVVAFGTLVDGNQVQRLLQPAEHDGVAVRFDVRGEDAAVAVEIVIEAAHAGVEKADHVLRAGWFGFAGVLGAIELADETGGREVGYAVVPEVHRHFARAAGDAGALHKPLIGIERDDHHGAGRLGVQARIEWLVDPAACQRQAVRDVPEDGGGVHQLIMGRNILGRL